MTIFSHAGNFMSAVSGGVDVRRGLFTASIHLASISGNYLAGPVMDLGLTYDPQNRTDQGFGVGWSVGWTAYETDTENGQQPLLLLNTGDSYKTDDNRRPISEGTQAVNFLQNKLISARVHKTAKNEQGEDSYILHHKSGNITRLTGPSVAAARKIPRNLYNASGQGLHFDIHFGSTPVITRICDDYGVTLASFDYTNRLHPVVTLWPGSSEELDIKFTLQTGALNRLTEVDMGSLKWGFEYDFNNDNYLHVINSPLGFKETAVYQPDAMLLPPAAVQAFGRRAFPAVVSLTQEVGAGQPPIYTSYSYQDPTIPRPGNYLGYNSSLTQWSHDHDNLYSAESGYQYTTTVKFYHNQADLNGKRNPLRVQRHTYNKFHLKISTHDEDYDEGKLTTTVVHETLYAFCNLNLVFDKLDPRFQCPTQQTLKYVKPDKSESTPEITKLDYDKWGNLTHQTDPDGLVTVWDYYDVDGEDSEEGKCPKAPIGVPTFKKSVTITPPPSAFDTPVRKAFFNYDKLPLAAEAPISGIIDYAVLPVQEIQTVNGVVAQQTDTQYYNKPGTHLHGRVQTVSSIYYADQADDADETASPTFEMSHSIETSYRTSSDDGAISPDHLETTHLVTGHDGLQGSSKSHVNRHTGKTATHTNPLGVQSTFAFDKLGRLSTHTLAANSSTYKTELNYFYQSDTVMGNAAWSKRVQQPGLPDRKDYVDGLGREFIAQQADTIVWQRGFDSQGRPAQDTAWDSVGTQSLKVTEQIAYDFWGGPCNAVSPNQSSQLITRDPVERTITQQLSFPDSGGMKVYGGITETIHDERNLPIIINVYNEDKTLYSTETFEYDGLKRLCKHVDVSGNTTLQSYDKWDRLIKTELSDGTVVDYDYVPPAVSHAPVAIYLNGKCVGKREFDGLSRIRWLEVGGRRYEYSYEGASTSPSLIKLPSGKTISYTYEKDVGNKVTKVEYAEGAQSFCYDPATWLLKQYKDDGAGGVGVVNDYTDGLLTTQTITTSSGEQSTTAKYSLRGRLSEYTGAGGDKWKLDYDDIGRLSRIGDDSHYANIFYDKQKGFLSGWEVYMGTAKGSATIVYDDFMRRQQIQTTFSNGDTLTVSYDYTVAGQVRKKTVTYQGAQRAKQIRSESYKYDSRARLIRVDYDEGRSKRKQNGIPSSIEYSYDAYSNIIKTKTTLGGGAVETKTGFFDDSDPCQLLGLGIIGPQGQSGNIFTYDEDGALHADNLGNNFTYDGLGRLRSVQKDGESGSTTYEYDALNLLRAVNTPDGEREEQFYIGTMLVGLLRMARGKSTYTGFLMAPNGAVLSQYTGPGAKDNWIHAADANGTVLYAMDDTGVGKSIRYDVYGMRLGDGDPKTGFNAQPFDRSTSGYLLGQGYRLYSPGICRFTKPDSLSPFGAGGINSYAYCSGDPVNRIDPTGHAPSNVGNLSNPKAKLKKESDVSFILQEVLAGIITIVGAAAVGFGALTGNPLAIGVGGLLVAGGVTQLIGNAMTFTGSRDNDKDEVETGASFTSVGQGLVGLASVVGMFGMFVKSAGASSAGEGATARSRFNILGRFRRRSAPTDLQSVSITTEDDADSIMPPPPDNLPSRRPSPPPQYPTGGQNATPQTNAGVIQRPLPVVPPKPVSVVPENAHVNQPLSNQQYGGPSRPSVDPSLGAGGMPSSSRMEPARPFDGESMDEARVKQKLVHDQLRQFWDNQSDRDSLRSI